MLDDDIPFSFSQVRILLHALKFKPQSRLIDSTVSRSTSNVSSEPKRFDSDIQWPWWHFAEQFEVGCTPTRSWLTWEPRNMPVSCKNILGSCDECCAPAPENFYSPMTLRKFILEDPSGINLSFVVPHHGAGPYLGASHIVPSLAWVRITIQPAERKAMRTSTSTCPSIPAKKQLKT